MRERGMSFSDFQDLCRRNQASNAHITYYRDPDINPHNIAIFDRLKIRRKPDTIELTGYTEEDHWRDSRVCEMEFCNGEVPMEGYEPPVDRRADKLLGRPYRGALNALTLLIGEGSLRRTDELRSIFDRHGRRFPAAPVSAMAPD